MPVHKLAVLVVDGVVPFDLGVPCGVFGHARFADGKPAYQLRVCADRKTIRTGQFEIKVAHSLEFLKKAETIIVPGTAAGAPPISTKVLKALQAAAKRGARIASICSGAFILAEAGLLDGLRATTHWMGADALMHRYPLIEVDPNVLYVDNGQILTSAGAAAGLDLCLHMLRRDHGPALAADAARLAVMPLERSGGQAQFIMHQVPDAEGASLEPLLAWMEKNFHRSLSLHELAKKARMSPRNLSRRFLEQTGTSPLQWLLQRRVRQGQLLLETTAHSIDGIAERVGFGSGTGFREHFRRLVGTSPVAYRHSFRRRS